MGSVKAPDKRRFYFSPDLALERRQQLIKELREHLAPLGFKACNYNEQDKTKPDGTKWRHSGTSLFVRLAEAYSGSGWSRGALPKWFNVQIHADIDGLGWGVLGKTATYRQNPEGLPPCEYCAAKHARYERKQVYPDKTSIMRVFCDAICADDYFDDWARE